MLYTHTYTQLKRIIRSDGISIQDKHIVFHDITAKTLHHMNNQSSYPEWYHSFLSYPNGIYAKVTLGKETKIFYLGEDIKKYIQYVLVTQDILLRGIINPLIRHDNIVKSELSLNSFISYINSRFDYKFYLKNNNLYYSDELLVEYKHYNQIMFHIFVLHQLLHFHNFSICSDWNKKISVSGYDLTSKDGVFTRTKKVPKFDINEHPLTKTLDQFTVDSQLILSFDNTISNL